MIFGKRFNGDLIVVDVKSTSKNVFDWEDTYPNGNMPKAIADS